MSLCNILDTSLQKWLEIDHPNKLTDNDLQKWLHKLTDNYLL